MMGVRIHSVDLVNYFKKRNLIFGMKVKLDRLLVMLGTLLCGAVVYAVPLTIQVEKFNGLPGVFDPGVLVYLDGEIDSTSPKRVAAALDKLPNMQITIVFNSNGGNLTAAMELGRLIRKTGASTSVGVKGTEEFNSLPGACFSACTLAYLGGRYRYFKQGSKYGVHRAYLTSSTNGRDLEVGQVLSAMIGSYIREMDADPELLDLAVRIPSTDIYVLSDKELKDLQIVNKGRLPPSWMIEAVPGGSYLKGMQETVYGRGKAIFACIDGKFILFSVYEAGPKAKLISEGKWIHSLKVNDDDLPLGSPAKIEGVDGFINATFFLSRTLFQRVAAADSVGHAMQPFKDSPTFVGYSVDIDKSSRHRVRNFLNNCMTDRRK